MSKNINEIKNPNTIKNILEAILADMDEETGEGVENLTEDGTSDISEKRKKMYSTEHVTDGKPKIFSGVNIFEDLTSGHEEMASMMQKYLDDIAEDNDECPILRGCAATMHCQVADVFNQTQEMFLQLCKNFQHTILEHDDSDNE